MSEASPVRQKKWKRINGDRRQLCCAPDNGDPPPPAGALRDANATWMFVILGKPLCSCLSEPVQFCVTVCVCVCARVKSRVRVCLCSQDWNLGARVKLRQSPHPIPKAEYLPFLEFY